MKVHVILQYVASHKLFSPKTPLTIDNSCKESVKNSKFQVVCCFSRRKYQPKKPFCYNSDKCWAMKSVEPWKIVRIFSQIFHVLHYCIVNAAGHSCFSQQSARTFWLPLKISLFSNSQSKNFELFENRMSPEPFDSRAKAPPAKRREKSFGDENGETPLFLFLASLSFQIPLINLQKR